MDKEEFKQELEVLVEFATDKEYLLACGKDAQAALLDEDINDQIDNLINEFYPENVDPL